MKSNIIVLGLVLVSILVISGCAQQQTKYVCPDGTTVSDTSFCPKQEVKQEYQQPTQYCGDGSCNNGESCSSCSSDCGNCEYCGNGNCNSVTESCSNCPSDCGTCPPCASGKYMYYACIVGGGDMLYNIDTAILSSELTKTRYGDRCKFFQLASGDEIMFRLDVGAKGEIYDDTTGEKKKAVTNAYNVNANYNCVFDKYCSISCSVYRLFEEE